MAILRDFTIYFNYRTKHGRRHIVVLLLVIIALWLGLRWLNGGAPEVQPITTPPVEVSVLSIGELAATASFDTVGKVEAISEANLQTEAGGRVTAVNVKVGDSVRAGTVLASIENSAQQAALLQAQGSYEAALAAANQSTLGVGEAETAVTSARQSLLNVLQSAYNTANATLVNNIDQFYSAPQSSLPGLRLSDAQASWFNNERVAYQSLMSQWQTSSNNLTINSDLEGNADYTIDNLNRTIAYVDAFLTEFPDQENNGRYTTAEIESFISTFTNLRAALINARGAIQAAETALQQAEENVTRAQLSATGGGASATDAQVKIALGALQAARSNYQKTLVTSPISGVVNALYLKAGDFVSPSQPAAVVANNNGLQIKTFVSETDGVNLNIGDTVSIEGGASGVITAKADALDPATGKIAVVIGVDAASDLTNGATVRVTFSQISKTETNDRILVPLSALKITPEGTFVFTVNGNNELEAVAVTQGQLYGENIELIEGVTRDTRIVTDARGLKAGQVVTVK